MHCRILAVEAEQKSQKMSAICSLDQKVHACFLRESREEWGLRYFWGESWIFGNIVWLYVWGGCAMHPNSPLSKCLQGGVRLQGVHIRIAPPRAWRARATRVIELLAKSTGENSMQPLEKPPLTNFRSIEDDQTPRVLWARSPCPLLQKGLPRVVVAPELIFLKRL